MHTDGFVPGVENDASSLMQGMRPKLWAGLVSILSKLGTLQMEQLRNQALVILQRYPGCCPCRA